MAKKGGLDAAAKLLAGLDPSSQKKIVELMKLKDPKMAELIFNQVVTFEDLQKMTIKMLQELLREIDIKDLALALRLGSEELKSYFLSNISSSMRKDIEDILLGPPQSVSNVEEAIAKIMVIVRQKMERGEIILRDDNETYV